jgi:hypothetical protein
MGLGLAVRYSAVGVGNLEDPDNLLVSLNHDYKFYLNQNLYLENPDLKILRADQKLVLAISFHVT